MCWKRFIVLLPLLVSSGCIATDVGRYVRTTLYTVGGAALGQEIGNGPGAAAAGAGAGYVAGEVINYTKSKQLREVEQRAAARARSDAAKQMYWILKDQQQTRHPPVRRDYRVMVPSYTRDGILYDEHERIMGFYE